MPYSPQQVADLLPVFFKHSMQVMLTGPAGCGKTDMMKQAAQATGRDLIISHLSVADPTDVRGIPAIGDESIDGNTKLVANFIPIGQMRQLQAATDPTIWFLDDLGNAPMAVLSGVQQLIHSEGRELEGFRLPDCVLVCMASNRVEDGANVYGIPIPVLGRIHQVMEVEPDLKSWLPWAINNNIADPILAYLHYMEQMSNSRLFLSTDDISRLEPPVSPRTWAANVNPLMTHQGDFFTDPETRRQLLIGAIGQAVGIEFNAFLDSMHRMISLTDIRQDPESAPLPSSQDLDIIYLTVGGMISTLRQTPDTSHLDAYVRWIDRLSMPEVASFLQFSIHSTEIDALINSRPYGRLVTIANPK